VGESVVKSDRCCGESGTLGVTRPDIATQVRFRKEEELLKNEQQLAALKSEQLALSDVPKADKPIKAPTKILTSCPSCLQGLSRFGNDLNNGLLEADYVVVEMANLILGENWMPEYVAKANDGGIERVLV
jgi:Fe-S oxidoreductase